MSTPRSTVVRLLAPRLVLAHLAGAVLVAAAGWLGLWQLQAWELRRAADAVDPTELTPVPLADVMGSDDAFPGHRVGQPVLLDGDWVPEGGFLVSGRESGGADGYWVVSPLAVGGGGVPASEAAVLLVVRGWTSAPDEVPEPPTGRTELVAWMQPGEGTGEVDEDPGDDVLPQLRLADALQRVDQDLYSAYAIVADRVAPGDWPVGDRAVNPGTDGLEQVRPGELPESGRFTALRNLLYAVEWWLFGAFAGFVWWRYVRDELAMPQDAPSGPETSEDPVPSEP